MEHRLINEPWFIRNPSALYELRESLHQPFPNLHVLVEDGAVIVRGTIPILWQGQEIDRYSIELKLASDHPDSVPQVWEIAGRIPRTPDRHANPLDGGTLCLGVPEEVWSIGADGFDLATFLNGAVRTFLIGNSLVELGEKWPHGEWPHGPKGICQFYGEYVGFSDPPSVLRLLEYLSKQKVLGHWLCPCGSGKIIRNCHRETIMRAHNNLPKKAISYSLSQLKIWLISQM